MVGWVDIGDRWIGSEPFAFRRRSGAWETTPRDRLISARQIAEALAPDDARVVLLTLDGCGGGLISESLDVYRALRAFADAGGVVVTHTRGIIGSTAPLLATAGCLAIADPTARLLLHCPNTGSQMTPDAIENVLPWFGARTLTPPDILRDWLMSGAPGRPDLVTVLTPEVALAHGWVDGIGTVEDARALAEAIAAGMPVPRTPRGEVLASRAAAPGPEVDPRAVGTIQTSDYAEDSAGNVLSGAKLAVGNIGGWASGTAYVVGNVVLSGGILYRCQVAHTAAAGNAPPNATYWKVYAQGRFAPTGLQIGSKRFSESMIGRVGFGAKFLDCTGNGAIDDFTGAAVLGICTSGWSLVTYSGAPAPVIRIGVINTSAAYLLPTVTPAFVGGQSQANYTPPWNPGTALPGGLSVGIGMVATNYFDIAFWEYAYDDVSATYRPRLVDPRYARWTLLASVRQVDGAVW